MNTAHTDRGILWLKLSPESRQALAAAYPAKFEDIYYDHQTLLFGVDRKDVAEYIGKQESAEVYAHSYNDRIEAVRVRSRLPDTYGVPHITLSARTGVKAFESVAMLRSEHAEVHRDTPLVVTGTLEFVPLD